MGSLLRALVDSYVELSSIAYYRTKTSSTKHMLVPLLDVELDRRTNRVETSDDEISVQVSSVVLHAESGNDQLQSLGHISYWI